MPELRQIHRLDPGPRDGAAVAERLLLHRAFRLCVLTGTAGAVVEACRRTGIAVTGAADPFDPAAFCDRLRPGVTALLGRLDPREESALAAAARVRGIPVTDIA